ncbi:polysaccharide deacetylase family protein [Rapidithrix thailandica]|uniref:Polysaccharide deacetylase family protein n=1 Tax=Rapidithrix thailandica TaxID=413964 RepID=A0AAW9SH86_9BACT
MIIHKMGWPFKKVLYPSLTWSRSAKEKIIYLTFDDGPIPEITEFVLDTLLQKKVKATFFCVGDNVRKHPRVFQRVLEEGHGLGNHTFNHLNGWKTAFSEYVQNIDKCQAYLDPALNGRKWLFRPPYGRITKKQIRAVQQKGYEVIMWDVLSADFMKSLDKKNCLQKTVKYSEQGSIVVFHDNIKAFENMSYALPRYIDTFQAQGYKFGTLN